MPVENKSKRNVIISYLKKNPKATYIDIRKDTKLHPERYFKRLAEAFKEADLKAPRTFERKTKEQRKNLIINYLKRNPKAGGQNIARDLKISVTSAFKNTKEAFEAAGLVYPRKYPRTTKDEARELIINIVKKDPEITINEIISNLGIYPYRYFRNFGEICELAGIKKIGGHEKRHLKIKRRIVSFIKQNPLATQREINKNCKTTVQHFFPNGIFDAYKKAGVKYPYQRLKLYGTALKEIKERARDFQKEIAITLSGYGFVNRLVKTKRGVADMILERKNKKIPIEVKDYQKKEISITQIKQLNKYLEDLGGHVGILVCHQKPKKDKFIIGKNKLFVLEKKELDKIPSIVDT